MDAATRTPHPLADLYGRPPLDVVIEVAHAVAADHAARPRRYRCLPAATAEALIELHDHSGAPEWPDKRQRADYYDVLSGKGSGGGHPQTCLAEATFLDAVDSDDGSGGKSRRGLHDTARTFRDYLRCADGKAVASASQRTAAMFDRAAAILADQAVAAAFACAPPDCGARAFASSGDSAAACLVEAITQELEPATTGIVPRYTFLVAQRLAAARRDTVDAVLRGDFESDAGAFDDLLQNASTWARALRDFHADTVIRAWNLLDRDDPRPDYSLLDRPDNPAGWRLRMESLLDSLSIACGGT